MILTYGLHSINTDASPISLSPSKLNFFIKFAKWLGFEFITYKDYERANKSKHRFIILTFDDGYKDNVTNALPILNNYNIRSVCLIVYNAIAKTNFWDTNKCLKKYPQKNMLNEEDIKQWLAYGNEIGSHSMNHYNLTTLSNDELITEIKDSKNKIEELIRTDVLSFCCPYNKTTTQIEQIINKEYKYIVPVKRQRLSNHKFVKDILTLLWWFLLHISGIYNYLYPVTGSCINNCKRNIFINFSYWENKNPTNDEKEIVHYINNIEYSKSNLSILHIGTGVSYPAQYIKKYRSIDSFTICRGELEHALQFNNRNYNVFLKDKHEKNCFIGWNKKYDIIIDNNIRSFCCCEKAFDHLFSNYYDILNNGGIIITHKDGMKWSTQLKPKFCFKSFKWVLKEKGSNPLGSFTLTMAEEKAKEFNIEFIVDNNIIVFKK